MEGIKIRGFKMITKKGYNDEIAIEQDKENFINYAINKDFKYNDVLDFMMYYENLKSFEDNLKELKRGVKKC